MKKLNIEKSSDANVSKFAIFVSGFVAVTTMVGMILASSSVKAIDEVTDVLDLSLPVTCALTNSDASTSMTLTNGVASTTSGASLTASCNDTGGFALYAVGYSSDTEGNTNLVSGTSSSYNIATGTATSGDTSNWAMMVTPVASGLSAVNSFGSYHAIPSSYTRVAEKSSGMIAGEFTVASTSYQVFASTSQHTGDYVGKVKYTLVHPSTEECPEGYYMSNNVCVQRTMQTVATWGSTLSTNVSVQAIDSRDNKRYYVAKLADGNIWMTQNLDYVLSTGTTLTPSDSDVSANWTPNQNTQTTQYKESDGTTHSEAIWSNDYNTTAHSYRPASDAAAGTSGKYGTDSDTYYSPVIMTNGTTMSSYKSEAECVAGGYTAEQCAHWNVGTFYSWYAATAGTGNGDVSTAINVTDSVCPAGWHLPSSTSSGEFQALVTAAGLTASNITGAPYYFLRPGRYLGNGNCGAVYDTGSYGFYWSSTSYSSTSAAYNFYFNSSNILPSGDFSRYNGMSVRCIADS